MKFLRLFVNYNLKFNSLENEYLQYMCFFFIISVNRLYPLIKIINNEVFVDCKIVLKFYALLVWFN